MICVPQLEKPWFSLIPQLHTIWRSEQFLCLWPLDGGPGQLSRYTDSPRARWSGDRIPVGAKFSSPVQAGPGAHPASYKMGTGSFPGVKRPGRGVDHPSPSRTEVEGRVELYICSPSGPSWPVVGRPLSLLKELCKFILICLWNRALWTVPALQHYIYVRST